MMMSSVPYMVIAVIFFRLYVTVVVGSVSLDDGEIPCRDDEKKGSGCIVSEEVADNKEFTKTVQRHDVERSVRWKKINAIAKILENDQDLTDTRFIDMKNNDLYKTRLDRKRQKLKNNWPNNLFRDPETLGDRNNRAIFKMLNLQFRNVLSAVTIFSETVQNDISASKRKKLADALKDVVQIVKTVEQASMDSSKSVNEVISVYRTRSRLLELVIDVVTEVVDIALTVIADMVTLVIETAENAVNIVLGSSPTPQPAILPVQNPTPAPKVPTPAPVAVTTAPKAPIPAPKAPTPAPKAPTPAPKVSTPAPKAPNTKAPTLKPTKSTTCVLAGFSVGSACTTDAECCNSRCTNNTCTCIALGLPCNITTPWNCCSNSCGNVCS